MNNLSLKQKVAGFFLAIATALGGGYGAYHLGSAVTGQDYSATSTRSFAGVALTNLTVIKTGYGSLNRVTIGGTNNGVIRLWDATTTDVNKRTGNAASSTIFITEIGTNATTTLDFDVDLKNGLIYELVTGNAPTSTIVYR